MIYVALNTERESLNTYKMHHFFFYVEHKNDEN